MPYPIKFDAEYPDKLSRVTTFFRLFMLIPQMIVLYFIEIAAGVIWIIAWFAILFTGRFPKSLFDFTAWYMRWTTRVGGYAMFMTDKYPPFSGSADTPPAPQQQSPIKPA